MNIIDAMIQENVPMTKEHNAKTMFACEMANCINDMLQAIGIRVTYGNGHSANRQHGWDVYLKKIDDCNIDVYVELVGEAGRHYVCWNSIPSLRIDSLENCTYGILNRVSRFVFLKDGKTISKKENPYLGCSCLEEMEIKKDLLGG